MDKETKLRGNILNKRNCFGELRGTKVSTCRTKTYNIMNL